MEYKFTAYGHKNVMGKHKKTFEFTKDKELTLEGDCILGVKSDFDLCKLRNIVKKGKKIKMFITVDDISDSVIFEPNLDFGDAHEIVVRKSEFNSKRTLGIKADKACSDLKKELIEKLSNPEQRIDVLITDV